ncbi:Inner membrane protein YbhQ / putative membrane protein [Bordetella pertussis]|nr:Inner membrane protein YbhQ / putative membrane protein [Bordetella pertussis]
MGAALLAGALAYLYLCRYARRRAYTLRGQGRAPYPEVLAILLFSSIAALLAHIPGGLGVIEALFAAALATRMPASESLGAVLMYRLLYAWIPLCVALPAYLGAEWRHRRAAAG